MRARGVAVTAMAGGLALACTRVAQVPPQELPKLNGHSPETSGESVELTLVTGNRVAIKPGYRSVRFEVQQDDGWTSFPSYRAPVHVEVRDGVLEVEAESRRGLRHDRYLLQDVKVAEVVQSDTSHTTPLAIGAGVGALVGAGVALWLYSTCDPPASGTEEPEEGPSFDLCQTSVVVPLTFGAMLGGGVGVLVGLPFTMQQKYYR